MKLILISILSALFGFFLAFSAWKTAEHIAKAAMLRTEMAQNEIAE